MNDGREIVGPWKEDDEQPQYDLDDPDILFSFRVHHGGGYDDEMENYMEVGGGGFDYLNLDELSMLDLDDIALELGYKLPARYWIQMPGKWQLTEIPCIHGMSALLNSNHDPIQFVHKMYKKEKFMKAYNPVIYDGINRPSMWPNTNKKPVQVPEFKK
ncbi:hypothetical protein Dsin_012519 [Dipteronia sinensis]|uniref:Uncharacterized protein n=1 Tax=Dipteronia sinensis TaxID=43782 RepID=A0AAE0AJE5_9ROSI|nr:hypothetical protein Dsin_012519 [Dipteronia sinensis]